eukprot:s1_g2079.t1
MSSMVSRFLSVTLIGTCLTGCAFVRAITFDEDKNSGILKGQDVAIAPIWEGPVEVQTSDQPLTQTPLPKEVTAHVKHRCGIQDPAPDPDTLDFVPGPIVGVAASYAFSSAYDQASAAIEGYLERKAKQFEKGYNGKILLRPPFRLRGTSATSPNSMVLSCIDIVRWVNLAEDKPQETEVASRIIFSIEPFESAFKIEPIYLALNKAAALTGDNKGVNLTVNLRIKGLLDNSDGKLELTPVLNETFSFANVLPGTSRIYETSQATNNDIVSDTSHTRLFTWPVTRAIAGDLSIEVKEASFSLTAASAQRLDFVPSALSGADNSGTEIPVRNIRLYKSANAPAGETVFPLKAQTREALTLDVDLTGLSAGEYSGQLLFASLPTTLEGEDTQNEVRHRGHFAIPVTIRIRDSIGWALFVLIVSIGLGWYVALYKKTQLPADTLLSSIADVRERADEFGFTNEKPGYANFAQALRMAHIHIHFEEIRAASIKLSEAKSLLHKWVKEYALIDGRELAFADLETDTGISKQDVLYAAARTRVSLYRCIIYLFAAVSVTMAGLLEIYEKNPTFGADGWMDYIALFVWGTSSQAVTRALDKLLISQNPAPATIAQT